MWKIIVTISETDEKKKNRKVKTTRAVKTLLLIIIDSKDIGFIFSIFVILINLIFLKLEKNSRLLMLWLYDMQEEEIDGVFFID